MLRSSLVSARSCGSQSPQANFRPYRERPDQATFVACRVVRNSDVIDVDPIFLLQGGSLAGKSDNVLRHFSWNHGEDIEVRRLSPQSVVLADDEATDAMEIDRRVQLGVQLREERQPRLGGTVKRHCQHPQS